MAKSNKAGNKAACYPRKLSSAALAIYQALDERDKEAFRVQRNWARYSAQYPAFEVNCVTLAARLSVSGDTA